MNRPARLAALVAVTATLAACNPLSLLPPIPIGDALGVQGTTLTYSPMMAATVRGTTAVLENLPNLDAETTSKITSAPQPQELIVPIKASDLTVTGCDISTMTSVTLTIDTFAATLSDNQGDVSASLAAPLEVTFSKSTAGYTASAANTTNLVFGNIGTAISILTAGEPNTVAFSSTISGADALSGCVFTITLGESNSQIKF